MKQLNKEQQQTIKKYLIDHASIYLAENFVRDFPSSCCDDCAEGHECASDRLTNEVREYTLGVEIKEVLDRNESEFDSNII